MVYSHGVSSVSPTATKSLLPLTNAPPLTHAATQTKVNQSKVCNSWSTFFFRKLLRRDKKYCILGLSNSLAVRGTNPAAFFFYARSRSLFQPFFLALFLTHTIIANSFPKDDDQVQALPCSTIAVGLFNSSDTLVSVNQRTWNIQLRYSDGLVVNAMVHNVPTNNFSLTPKGPHFQVFLILLRCGENIEIMKTVYKEVAPAKPIPPMKSA